MIILMMPLEKHYLKKHFKSCSTYETMDWETFKNIQWQSSIDDNGKLIIKRVENDTNL